MTLIKPLDSAVTEVPSTEYKIITKFLSEELHRENVLPHDHFVEQLSMDSLDMLYFTEFVSRSFAIQVTTDTLLQLQNIKQLANYIEEHRDVITPIKVNWTSILTEKNSVKYPSKWITFPLVRIAANLLYRSLFKFKSSGLENIPQNEPFILASNHQSYLDSLLVTMALKPSNFRNCYFFAKEKHVTSAFLRFIGNASNVIILDSDLKSSVQKLAKAIQDGNNLVIFPEGTRTKDGKLGEYKQLFAILSKELGVPIVPAVISGAFEAMPTGSSFPKLRAPITIQYLEPIQPELFESYNSLAEKVRVSTLSKSSF